MTLHWTLSEHLGYGISIKADKAGGFAAGEPTRISNALHSSVMAALGAVLARVPIEEREAAEREAAAAFDAAPIPDFARRA
jgi:hypothetical protein